jgi:Pyridoxamine 5'-phosphate oxidase
VSSLIGDRLPAPLRFEFGMPPAPGAQSHAVLLATVDEGGTPRIAVLSTAEIVAADERRLRVKLRTGSSSLANVAARGKAAIWCVLDAAAYTIKGTARFASGPSDEGWQAVDFEVESVWRDFEEGAPMIGGPTYRAPAIDETSDRG